MGLFRKKKKSAPEPGPPNVPGDWDDSAVWADWEPPRNWIAGESRYPEAFLALAGEVRDDGYLLPVAVVLEREPENDYDENAIVASVRGHKVGYISRDVAAVMSPALDQAGVATVTVCGIIRGGAPEFPNFGVHLWLDRHPVDSVSVVLEADSAGEVGGWPPSAKEIDRASRLP